MHSFIVITRLDRVIHMVNVRLNVVFKLHSFLASCAHLHLSIRGTCIAWIARSSRAMTTKMICPEGVERRVRKREVGCLLTHRRCAVPRSDVSPMLNRNRPLLLGGKKGKSPPYELAYKIDSPWRKIHLFQEGHAG
jgi:hypothetical protein